MLFSAWVFNSQHLVQAPHHSANSWTWHWKRSKCDLPWELRYANFATARIHSKSIGSDMSESGSDRESASSGSEAESRSQKHEPLKIRLRPLLRVSREAALEPAPGIGHEVELESTDDEGKVMGIGGGPITDGDKRAVAFNLMTLTNNPDYENMSEADKWLQFALRYPQRSYRAWAQLYRNHKTGEWDLNFSRYARVANSLGPQTSTGACVGTRKG